MCGLAGIYNYRDKCPIDAGILKQMGDLIAHRGPDEVGYYTNDSGNVGLVHRRLSIIDLAAGQQPMCDAEGKMWIVFNGEIYNYKVLRDELNAFGYRFNTNSDTEVLLNYYKHFGVKGLQKLNGIFSFAVYDQNAEELVLARDHFGVKPLYYANINGSFIFSSEVKSLISTPFLAAEVNTEALNQFLTFRYNPSPTTLFQNIQKLQAGHYLKLNKLGQVILGSFWDYRPKINKNIKESDAIAEYQFLLDRAVQRQLVSDVPVGLFLSGGVDSAVVGALMRKHNGGTFNSYSVGFEGKGSFNELSDAASTAKWINSQHYKYTITQQEYLQTFFSSMYYTEEPIAEPTIPALFYVSKLAREHGKVVLSGQGADEPLAGYRRYLGEKVISKFGGLLNKVPISFISDFFPRSESLHRAKYAIRFDHELHRFLAIYSIFTEEEKKQLLLDYNPQKIILDSVERLYKETNGLTDSLAKILYIDTRQTLSDNLLIFGDKITMANSLECRVPFLDIDLIMFLESLPSNLKLNGFTHKYIHKKSVRKWLPDEIIYRKKRAFATPMDQWLQNDLANKFLDLIDEPNSGCARFFNKAYIRRIVQLHRERKANYYRRIFTLFSFEIWYRQFIVNVPVTL